jgi:glycosyltransferase involved in cell wall biosynthesis
MRDVLFISYYVPPRPGIATTRTRQLIKHLSSYGWNVTAFTAQLEGASPDVVQSPYVDIRGSIKRTLGLHGSVTHDALRTKTAAHNAKRSLRQFLIETAFNATNYPDAQAGWYFGGRKTLRSLLASRSYDIVLSSAPPFTTNLMIAWALRCISSERSIPWIADFRDLWIGNVLYGTSPVRKFFDQLFEKRSLQLATALTTISQPMANELQKRYPDKPTYVIPNAFDATEWEAIPFATSERCTFLYAGDLTSGRRDPEPLFRVVRNLLDRGEIQSHEITLDFYCEPERWLFARIAEHRLGNVVRVHGTVPRDTVLAAERRADRLLVLLWDGPSSEGILTGKIFEYLGARRRIITIGGPPISAVDAVLAESGAGTRYMSDSALESEVLRAIMEHRSGKIQIVPPDALAPFEASTLARRFADVFNAVCP